jgi:hypothetical protein
MAGRTIIMKLSRKYETVKETAANYLSIEVFMA